MVQKQDIAPSSTSLSSSTPKNAKKYLALSVSSIIILILLITAAVIFLKPQEVATLTASRYLPNHYIPGKPFPVAISIDFESKTDQSYVVKEKLPSSSVILNTVPEVHLKGTKDNTLKWLKKAKMGNTFIYVVTLPQNIADTTQMFVGTVSHGKGETKLEILGNSQTKASIHHWADSDSDNRISDQEILSAYDLYNGAPGINFDLIEEIWMGTGYRWDPTKSSVVLLP